MLSRSQMHPYQDRMVDHVLHNLAVQQAGGAGEFLGTGMGKSIITATAAAELITNYKVFDKVLIVAPKLVAEETWATEFGKWDHLGDMVVSVVAGNPKQRKKALMQPAHVYCIGRDNLEWLVGIFQGYWPFKFVVLDELSSFKNPTSNRFTAMRRILGQVQLLVGLTGTPVPNGLKDIWAQMYLIDRGKRLGDDIAKFHKEFFTWDVMPETHAMTNIKLRQERDPLLGKDVHASRIYSLIDDICVSMKARDYLTLPPRNDIFLDVHMPPAAMNQYKEFKRTYMANINGQDITAFSAAGLYSKLLQYANGAVYDNEAETQWHVTHEVKLDMLEEIVEFTNAPILVAYSFRSDVARIMKRFAKLRPEVLGPGVSARWNKGQVKMLLIHPSNGYGHNIQAGSCNLVWMGIPWNLEWYQQTRDRLDRQGQAFDVNNYHLLCPGTLEYEVAKRLTAKEIVQNDFMNALKAEMYA